MSLDALSIAGGFVCLYFGANWLVSGSAGLARRLGMRPLIIGLTVVAFGTSAPELVVSIVAALDGRSAIALGNVLGSSIANLGLILGLTALLSPPKVESTLIRREIPVMFLAAAIVPALIADGSLGRSEGLVLFAGAMAFTWLMIRVAAGHRLADSTERQIAAGASEEAARGGLAYLLALTVIGIGVLVFGGSIFVDGASGLAAALGISERVIGLTIVAIGTSLPEMATSVVAALKGHPSLAVGNVVGSNIYNVLLILGAAALVQPMTIAASTLAVDMAVAIGLTLIAAFFMRTERTITRTEGAMMLVAYAAYLVYLGAA